MCDDLLAIAINGAKGHGALHLPRDLDCRCEMLARVVKREGLWSPLQRVARTATVYADGAASRDVRHTRFLMKRIDYGKAYSPVEACTNQAESFFSRLRRSEIGTHHHFAGRYLPCYSNEMAWRENNRRVSNGAQYLKVTEAALNAPVSRMWKEYWQWSV